MPRQTQDVKSQYFPVSFELSSMMDIYVIHLSENSIYVHLSLPSPIYKQK